jgi:hypothetical protein
VLDGRQALASRRLNDAGLRHDFVDVVLDVFGLRDIGERLVVLGFSLK